MDSQPPNSADISNTSNIDKISANNSFIHHQTNYKLGKIIEIVQTPPSNTDINNNNNNEHVEFMNNVRHIGRLMVRHQQQQSDDAAVDDGDAIAAVAEVLLSYENWTGTAGPLADALKYTIQPPDSQCCAVYPVCFSVAFCINKWYAHDISTLQRDSTTIADYIQQILHKPVQKNGELLNPSILDLASLGVNVAVERETAGMFGRKWINPGRLHKPTFTSMDGREGVGPTDEQKVHVINGESGTGKTVGCISVALYSANPADSTFVGSPSAASRNNVSGSHVTIDAAVPGPPPNSANGSCILIDVNSLLIEGEAKRNFRLLAEYVRLNPKDEHAKNLRNAACAARFVRAILKALRVPDHVDDHLDGAGVIEAWFTPTKLDPPPRLAPEKQIDFVGSVLSKLNDRAKTLAQNWPHLFDGRLVLVLDEIGAASWLLRGLTAVWSALLLPLKKLLNMSFSSSLVFLACGSGSENFKPDTVGTSLSTFELLTMNPQNFFAQALYSRSWEDSEKGQFCAVTFNLMFKIKEEKKIQEPEPHQTTMMNNSKGQGSEENNTNDNIQHQNNNDDEALVTPRNSLTSELQEQQHQQQRNSFSNEIPPSLDGNNNNNNSNAQNNEQLLQNENNDSVNLSHTAMVGNDKYEFGRLHQVDASMMRYVSLTTRNARCAAIALRIIDQQFPAGSEIALKQRDSWKTTCAPEAIRAQLPMWALKIAAKFAELNGFSELSPSKRLRVLSRALLISISRQKSISEDDEKQLMIKCGILEDSARWVNEEPKSYDNYEALPTEDSGHEKIYLIINKRKPRYRMSEAAVALLLTNFGGCYAGSGGGVGSAYWDLFEQAVADHHALCAALNFASSSSSGLSTMDHLPPSCRMFYDANVKVTAGVYFAKLDRQLGRNAATFSSEFALWTRLVNQGYAVVLINGARAPFADVIVLTKGALFLTQCKHLADSSRCDAKAEFKKMNDSRKTDKVFFALIRCCCGESSSNPVRVVCSIFLRSDKSPITNDYSPSTFSDNFTSQKQKIEYQVAEKYLYAFPSKSHPNELFCTLYPVLQAPLKDLFVEADAQNKVGGNNNNGDDESDDEDGNNKKIDSIYTKNDSNNQRVVVLSSPNNNNNNNTIPSHYGLYPVYEPLKAVLTGVPASGASPARLTRGSGSVQVISPSDGAKKESGSRRQRDEIEDESQKKKGK